MDGADGSSLESQKVKARDHEGPRGSFYVDHKLLSELATRNSKKSNGGADREKNGNSNYYLSRKLERWIFTWFSCARGSPGRWRGGTRGRGRRHSRWSRSSSRRRETARRRCCRRRRRWRSGPGCGGTSSSTSSPSPSSPAAEAAPSPGGGGELRDRH